MNQIELSVRGGNNEMEEYMRVDEERWKKTSIYRLPAHIKSMKYSSAYRPQLVSLGPFHHGDDSHDTHLLPMEWHKNRAFLHLAKWAGVAMEVFAEAVEKAADQLEAAYGQDLDERWLGDNRKRFVDMMVTDGCFLLEAMRMIELKGEVPNYAPNDPVFSKHGYLYLKNVILADMFVMENQLPMLLLGTLARLVPSGRFQDVRGMITNMVVAFFGLPSDKSYLLDARLHPYVRSLHPIDIARKILCGERERIADLWRGRILCDQSERYADERYADELREIITHGISELETDALIERIRQDESELAGALKEIFLHGRSVLQADALRQRILHDESELADALRGIILHGRSEHQANTDALRERILHGESELSADDLREIICGGSELQANALRERIQHDESELADALREIILHGRSVLQAGVLRQKILHDESELADVLRGIILYGRSELQADALREIILHGISELQADALRERILHGRSELQADALRGIILHGRSELQADALREIILHGESELQADTLRERILHSESERYADEWGGRKHTMPSALELYEAGIHFRESPCRSLLDIDFQRGVLSMPVLRVHNYVGPVFLNLMAFEQLHPGAGNGVTEYLIFMDHIIDSAKDVALLRSKGVMDCALGSDEEVAELFNTLSKSAVMDPSMKLQGVRLRVNAYYRKPWNKWRASLVHTHFRNPWVFISLVAAAVLLVATLLQTIYTIKPHS